MGGDFGASGAAFKFSKSENLDLTKFGGGGNIGDPKPLGGSSVRWQPVVQGSLGILHATNDKLPDQLAGAESETRSFAIQFGGGGRFWFDEHFNVAPTFMGMYGHTSDHFDPRTNSVAASLVPAGRDQGILDWTADTWTVRPALELQLRYKWGRGIYTFTCNPVYYHTEVFSASNPNIGVIGNSGTVDDKIDADIPTGVRILNRELRTGGYLSRTELFGGLEDGLNGVDHIYELHGRLVLDYLGQLWKVQWLGLGASYLWGPDVSGWSVGLDAAFKF
jgi:hypothetical protein